MFIVTWAAAMAIWKYAHVEEKWTARLNNEAVPPPERVMSLSGGGS
jgi:hypothetical protein